MSRTRPALALAAGAAALAALLAGCSSGTTTASHPDSSSIGAPSGTSSAPTSGGSGSASTGTASTGSSSTPAAPSTSPSVAATYVNVRTLNNDGATYGVGMPVIAYFSRKPASAKAWQAATKVTVNGKPLAAAWYFETSAARTGYPYEAHLRPQTYWPAHSQIHVSFPARGTSLGGTLAADGKLSSLDFSTGAANISTVNNTTHMITVTSDGKVKYRMPVSLGSEKDHTTTLNGTKVIMEKGLDIRMTGPGYDDPHVKYTQRLTYGGEYLHSAPWNCTSGPGCVGPANNIGHSNSSNGCTNLTPTDAKTLYDFLNIGDVVRFPNADGKPMTLGAGYGDWNLSWAQWQTGGAVSTTA